MDATIGMTQFGSSAALIYAMQKIKNSDAPPFRWLKHTGQIWIKRGISVFGALMIHTGISKVWNPNPTVEGGHILILTIPPLVIILEGLWHWFCQYALQEFMYQAAVNKPALTTDSAGSIPARVAPGGAMVVPEAAK